MHPDCSPVRSDSGKHASVAVCTQALPRRGLQLLVVLLVLLPLCRLPSLKPLAPASLFGVLGTAATALCIVVRLLDGSYAPEGAYFEDVRWTPAFSAGAAGITTRLPSSYGLAFFLSLLSQAVATYPLTPVLLARGTVAAVLARQGFSLRLSTLSL